MTPLVLQGFMNCVVIRKCAPVQATSEPESTPDVSTFEDLVLVEDWDFSVPCEFKAPYHNTYGSGDAVYRFTYGHDCGMMKTLLTCHGCLDQYKTITNKVCVGCGGFVEFLASTIIKIEDIK